MIIFKDAFSEDELCSDSFPMKLVDDLIYEFKGKHVVRKHGDIVLAGSNPSAEGEDADDGNDEQVERGIDFVLNHRLQEMNCYEDIATFQELYQEFHEEGDRAHGEAWILSLLSKDRFKKLQFFIGENMAEGKGEGQVAIVEYRDEAEGESPYLMLIAAGIIEEKT
uniref:Translationally-controlled tumor protein homolog n=1 Tax=Ditylenchus dipsaci TaxID=166011 RepID=A0A915D229_9BILA